MPPESAAFQYVQLLAFRALALLICDAAAGLASRLAGSLAFAATAILRALTQIAGLDGLDVFHSSNLHKNVLLDVIIFAAQSQHMENFFPFTLLINKSIFDPFTEVNVYADRPLASAFLPLINRLAAQVHQEHLQQITVLSPAFYTW